jgi:hypothetical protein
MSDVDVRNAVARFFRAVDEADWPAARARMTAPFHQDYASFGAFEAGDVDPAGLLSGWAGVLPGFEHTHHQLGNLEVTVDDAVAHVRCYGTATHVLEAEVWTVVGSYDLTLERAEAWRIRALRFDFRYQTGPSDLPVRAGARVAAGQGR